MMPVNRAQLKKTQVMIIINIRSTVQKYKILNILFKSEYVLN